MISTTNKSEIIRPLSPSDYKAKGHLREKIERTKALFSCQAKLKPLQSMIDFWNKTPQVWKEPACPVLHEPYSWAIPLSTQMEFPYPGNVSVAPAISQSNPLLWALALGKERETPLKSFSNWRSQLSLQTSVFKLEKGKNVAVMKLASEPKAKELLIWHCVPQRIPTVLYLRRPPGAGFLLVFLLPIIWFCWRVPLPPPQYWTKHPCTAGSGDGIAVDLLYHLVCKCRGQHLGISANREARLIEGRILSRECYPE